MRIIVTGGASGIGAAISRRLLEEGHQVLICYRQSAEEAAAIAAEFENAFIIRADVSRSEEIDALFAYAAENLGGVDAVINNAGVSLTKCFQTVSDEEFDRLMAINFGAVYKVSARAMTSMLTQKSGIIINISSIWGVRGAAAEALYSASKAAVIAFRAASASIVSRRG